MDEKKIIKIGIIGLIIVPAVIQLTCLTICGIGDFINNRAYNKKIKKGLEDGSIIEVDGKYYEVTIDEA